MISLCVKPLVRIPYSRSLTSVDHAKKLQFLLNLKTTTQKSPEWLAERQTKLTSSDTASALGTNRYQQPVELLFKKCGEKKIFICIYIYIYIYNIYIYIYIYN